ncbi:MAG TPA: hypothetical protein VFV65_06180 [Gemmatimonadales bacterium]|nr:hypothetical protein [Gemmatimonadales bacterium]
MWRRLLAGAALCGIAPAAVAAQGTVREWGLQGVAAFASPADYTAGLVAAVRPAARTRIALFAGGGLTSDGGGVGRAELVGHFLLNPRSLRPGLYAGGGLAGVFASGDANGFIVVLVGIESRPGGPGGWFVEAGVGGGTRVSAGYRWRKLPPGWRPKG